MPISIITRAKKSSELNDLIINISNETSIEYEIIAVCRIMDSDYYNARNFKLIIEDSNRFEARITGIKNSKYDKILLIDSDQILEEGLLEELENKKDDMVIIPERTFNNKSLVGKIMDDWRVRIERWAKEEPSPEIPVVPRFYRAEILKKAINTINADIYREIISHEDSVLYYKVYNTNKLVGFSHKHIFNKDPDFITFIKKSYEYGKNNGHFKKLLHNNNESSEIVKLISKINRNSFEIKALGFGIGSIMQTIKAVFYLCGFFKGYYFDKI